MSVTLAKGGNVSLSKQAPNLTKVAVGLGWDVRTTTGADYDLDASAEVPDGNAVAFAHGHLLAILIARWCGLPAVEGRRFALATATVSLLGWHREDRVIRALDHRVGDVLDPPFRT